jgi:hypothetical protein
MLVDDNNQNGIFLKLALLLIQVLDILFYCLHYNFNFVSSHIIVNIHFFFLSTTGVFGCASQYPKDDNNV